MAHRTEIKNVKNLAIEDASAYVRSSMESLVKLMSKEHRTVAGQFLQFRERTNDTMSAMNNYYQLLLAAELDLA